MPDEAPHCISILISDEIYRDEQTKKLIVVGTFNNINARSFPHKHPRFSVLFTLTNGQGTWDLCLAVEHARSGQRIFAMQGPARLSNPLQIADIHIVLEDIFFPEAGKYWVEVSANGTILAQRPLVVTDVSSLENPK